MSVTDSVSVFAEGTFEEQVHELVDYIARSRSDDERTAITHSFQEILKAGDGEKSIEEDQDRQRRALTLVLQETKGLGEGSVLEIEGYFNLLYSHLFTLWSTDSPETKQHISSLLQIISASPSEQSAVKYRLLSNLGNTTPRSSPLRLQIYSTLLQIASTNGELDVLPLSRNEVERWLKEWDISDEEKSAFLKSIIDALTKADQLQTAYEYTLSYITSLPSSSPASELAAIDAIAMALRLPTIFDFDPLFKLDAIVASKDHELFSLLQIFLNGGLPEFQAWSGSHAAAFEKYGLDKDQLEHKIRLLSFASLGFTYVGRDLPYSQISSTLEIDISEVEKWAIDLIRTGLLSGKLSQTTQSIHVYRSAARTFEREQWEALEKRLLAWKSGLAGVLEVVAAARKRPGGNATEALQQANGVEAVA
ncbi:hypothetical protein BJ138DRAFT_1173548 [Hygrophoropsis aurantiaca]|uniref:Uncharacterized protein n=1 Tax=Hygrophoropsis aurantiaca TaxID=72124 RepID=A0ACB8A9I4_9AGAM|nr:hypothetical protein BJ138DRAFT_1173548 [Hygrophoropsis aurantiaca]